MRLLSAAAAVLLLVLPAAAQPADTLFARATEAFAEEDYARSAALLEDVLRKDRRHAEAHFLQARLYHETPLRDLGRAKKAVSNAIKVRPEEPRYLALRLLIRYADPSDFLPPLQRERIRRLALKILRIDSTNAVAYAILGAQHADIFLTYDGAIALRARSGCSDRFDIDCLLEAGALPLDVDGQAENSLPKARAHLRRALALDPALPITYDYLLRLFAARNDYAAADAVLDTMRLHRPDDADTWLYSGWAHYHQQDYDAAARAFERALPLMTPEDRAFFEDPRFLMHDDDKRVYKDDPRGFTARFWAGKDPRLLSRYNERRLEHYARLVEADLLYAAPLVGYRGWQTDTGQLFLRYGRPPKHYVIRDTRFYASDNRALNRVSQRNGAFHVWQYEDFRFVFEDPDGLMNNWYRLYTPKAEEYARSTRPVVEQTDYHQEAENVRRRLPERSGYRPPGGRRALPFLPAAFKAEDGAAELVIAYGLPADLSTDAATTGFFLLDEDFEIVEETRGTVALPASSTTVSAEQGPVWPGLAQLRVPPGAYTLAAEFETAGGEVAGYERAPLAIPGFQGLAVSDVLPASLVEEGVTEGAAQGVLVRRGHAIHLAPTDRFDHTAPLYLYFETYGLTPDDAGTTVYEIEAVLVPWREGQKGLQKLLRKAFGETPRDGVAVSFDGTGTTPDAAHYLILDVANQSPGRYVLGLRLHDTVRGTTTETSREIVLR